MDMKQSQKPNNGESWEEQLRNSFSGSLRNSLDIEKSSLRNSIDIENPQESDNREPLAVRLQNSITRSFSKSISLERLTYHGVDNVLNAVMQSPRRKDKDEGDETQKLIALERLPTYDRLRQCIIKKYENGRTVVEQIDVRNMDLLQRKMLIDKLVERAPEGNEEFLTKLKDRMDRVGIQLPTVEVRFENLTIDGKCRLGSRALPTPWNIIRNFVEDLHSKRHTRITILKGVSGIIKPSRMTLLLGPPGSGKTSLLLALAGKLDHKLKLRGRITYNGQPLHDLAPQRAAAYISQDDVHLAELTVRETLEFSALCQGVGPRHDILLEVSRREKQAGIFPIAEIDAFMKATSLEGLNASLQTDYILKILGLNNCDNTLVGNSLQRGISGGQKKRVTTGEIIVGPNKTLFMDEISNGLDSSTALQVVKCLQQFVHILDGTIFMSLLQPLPELFELFDDLILLSEGQIVYQGPRENVLEFFETCGFKCPERKSVADFLQEITSRKDQEQYWAEKHKRYHFVSAKEFADRFENFHVGRCLAEELANPFPRESSHGSALTSDKYSVNKIQILKACFAREWILLKRTSFIYIYNGVQLIFLACITLTVFLQTNPKADLQDANNYLGAMFFSLVVIMFNSFSEMAITVSRLPVFFKQRNLLLYPAWAYTLPIFVFRISLSIIESGIWISLTYFAVGLSPEPSRFFRQYLLLTLMHQAATSLLRMIGGICQSLAIAFGGGTFGIILTFLLCGFLIPQAKIPKWWIWGYWVSPLAYAETAITINEFLAPRWSTTVNDSTDVTTGVLILSSRGLHTDPHYYWISIIALIAFIVIYNVIFTLALSYCPQLGSAQASMSEEAFAEMLASTNRSRDYLSKSTDDIQMDTRETGSMQKEMYNDGGPEKTAVKQKMSLPFEPLSISFQNIKYFVDMPPEMMVEGVKDRKLQLLQGITGCFRPGVLTALMGASGAGKTTLMDVLAGRKTSGYVEGKIYISGHPKVQETFARICSYCEQIDIHSPQITVQESLIYSAWLRLSDDVDSYKRMMLVKEVMELVEIDNLRDALVGLPGVSGLSTHQRKRLTIAVELVANPSIIFMDEPTTGLDARAAAVVMRAVRNTVDTGRTVVCTIHQPSMEIFEAFDELLLMKQGGQVIFAGPLGRQSHKVIEYFEAIPGVPKIKPNCNPATWMLEVTSVASAQQLGIDFADLFKASSLAHQNNELVENLSLPSPGSKDLHFSREYCASSWDQFKSLLWKQNLTYWRSPDYTLVRFSFTFITALIFGTLYWQLGTKIDEQEDLLTIMGSMYAATLFLGVTNSTTVQPVVDLERSVFYRERANQMYSSVIYALAQVAIEIPYMLVQTIMYGFIVYSMIGFDWVLSKFLWFLYTMFCTLLYFTYYGMMAVALTPNHQVAAVLATAFYAAFNLFCGFFIPRPNLPEWWAWYYWLCPTAWTVNGLITSQYGDNTQLIKTRSTAGDIELKPLNDVLGNTFGFHRKDLTEVAIVLLVFPLFFAFMFAFCFKILKFQHR